MSSYLAPLSRLEVKVLPQENELYVFAQSQNRLNKEVLSRAMVSGFDCRIGGKIAVRLGRKFICQVLLSLSKIELVNQDKFPAAASFKLADEQRV